MQFGKKCSKKLRGLITRIWMEFNEKFSNKLQWFNIRICNGNYLEMFEEFFTILITDIVAKGKCITSSYLLKNQIHWKNFYSSSTLKYIQMIFVSKFDLQLQNLSSTISINDDKSCIQFIECRDI